MVTIYSPGEYASIHSPEEYINKNVESEIRNEIIAKILYLNKSTEQFGSGFKRINKLCKDNNINYTYENKANGFKFIIYRPQIQSDTFNVTSDVTLNKTEKAVIDILKENPTSSREEIAQNIEKTVRTVQRTLDSLKEKGYIERIGSKQTPVWKILK
jgi:ATP-dependent DNA helicase RecG